MVNIDFMIGLPYTRCRHDSVWVIMDKITKSAYFLPVHMSYSIKDYTRIYLSDLVKLHGTLLSIVSNRGT